MPNVKVVNVVDVKTLIVDARPRYWEDTEVNGKEDTDGTLIPCRDGDSWKPVIDIETGVITNWKAGTVAHVHYKICDDGTYQLADAEGKIVAQIDGYVPSIMCPEEEGYGDYIIMTIDETGKIKNWKIDTSAFCK